MHNKNCKAMIFTDTDRGGIIHVANIKGGVGKSTVATNLSAALAMRGPTLIIDLDGQGSATHALGRDPVEFNDSSSDLFKNRYSLNKSNEFSKLPTIQKFKKLCNDTESFLFPQIVGKNDIRSLIVKIKPCLDLIPANSYLYKQVTFYQIQNLLFNIQLCRKYYKYIIIDTPSVWNNLTQTLYNHSTLNLIPVTLNSLSTKSLRDYLKEIKILSRKKPNMRIRIIKNEVFGSEQSKIKGKTRTMRENRQFLESLCEQIVIDNESGFSLLPQSVIFNIEIPESATIRNAQDLGKTVNEYRQYSSVSKSFEELAKQVQYVLNNPVVKKASNKFKMDEKKFRFVAKAVTTLIVLSFFISN
ncbi:MAG: ParA family protein, partial [Chitinispirillia bacterium]